MHQTFKLKFEHKNSRRIIIIVTGGGEGRVDWPIYGN